MSDPSYCEKCELLKIVAKSVGVCTGCNVEAQEVEGELEGAFDSYFDDKDYWGNS